MVFDCSYHQINKDIRKKIGTRQIRIEKQRFIFFI